MPLPVSDDVPRTVNALKDTVAPLVGLVIATDGSVVSGAVTVIVVEIILTFPALSVPLAWIV
jgi:hypothetical protein